MEVRLKRALTILAYFTEVEEESYLTDRIEEALSGKEVSPISIAFSVEKTYSRVNVIKLSKSPFLNCRKCPYSW